jgi:hypothetical protein
MTLNELLALLPDNDSGEIGAADLRTIVTELFNRDDQVAAVMQTQLDALGQTDNLHNDQIADLTARVAMLEERGDIAVQAGAWQFSDAPPPPTGSQVRLDSGDQHAASVAVFRLVDSDGADRTILFSSKIVGVRIQDWDDATNYSTYEVFPPVTVDATDATLALQWKSGGGTIPNQKVRCVFAIDVS